MKLSRETTRVLKARIEALAKEGVDELRLEIDAHTRDAAERQQKQFLTAAAKLKLAPRLTYSISIDTEWDAKSMVWGDKLFYRGQWHMGYNTEDKAKLTALAQKIAAEGTRKDPPRSLARELDDVRFHALDFSVEVVKHDHAAWQEFATTVDDAYLTGDVEPLVTALDMLEADLYRDR